MNKSLSVLGIALILFTNSSYSQSYTPTELIRLQQNQDYEGAIQYLLTFKTAFSKEVQFNTDMAYTYLLMDDIIMADHYVTNALSIDTLDKLANIYAGQLALSESKWAEAVYYYKRLTGIAPRQFRFWYNAGLAYTRLNQSDSAYKYLQEANTLNNRSADILINLTTALQRLKKYGAADSLINNYLQFIDSTNEKVVSKKVEIAYLNADYSQVVKWGEVLFKQAADVLSPYIRLAYTYLFLQRYNEAIKLCEWLIVESKGTVEVLYCAALSYSRLKQFDKSNALLDSCLQQTLQIDATTYFNAKAENYELQKQYQYAANTHDTAYYIFKTPLDAYYAGRIYDKYLKNNAKAALYYRRYIREMKPSATTKELEIRKYVEGWLKDNPKP